MKKTLYAVAVLAAACCLLSATSPGYAITSPASAASQNTGGASGSQLQPIEWNARARWRCWWRSGERWCGWW